MVIVFFAECVDWDVGGNAVVGRAKGVSGGGYGVCVGWVGEMGEFIMLLPVYFVDSL